MPTTIGLSPGVSVTMTQNQIYALPARTSYLIATQVLEFSLTTVTTDFVRVTASTTGMQTSHLFCRNTIATVATVVTKLF